MQLNTGFEVCETRTPMGLLVLLLCVEHPDWQADRHTHHPPLLLYTTNQHKVHKHGASVVKQQVNMHKHKTYILAAMVAFNAKSCLGISNVCFLVENMENVDL